MLLKSNTFVKYNVNIFIRHILIYKFYIIIVLSYELFSCFPFFFFTCLLLFEIPKICVHLFI